MRSGYNKKQLESLNELLIEKNAELEKKIREIECEGTKLHVKKVQELKNTETETYKLFLKMIKSAIELNAPADELEKLYRLKNEQMIIVERLSYNEIELIAGKTYVKI